MPDAGLHPIGMEHFAARPDRPVAACLKEVRETDLFVGVYGWRYGFVPNENGLSITEMEFSEAQRFGRPCFCFFVDPGFPWPEEYRDTGEPAARLDRFKRRMDGILIRANFTTSQRQTIWPCASSQASSATRVPKAEEPHKSPPKLPNNEIWRPCSNAANNSGLLARSPMLWEMPEPIR